MSENQGAEFAAAVAREAQGRSKGRDVRVLRQLWPFMAPYKGMIAGAAGFLLLSTGATLVIPRAVQQMITGSRRRTPG